ncbi:hypothetical protein FRB91_007789 [Serendipita sp. 411]|nr:hypothetical protein FRB91_007789 [Serendipita sp. 411]
MSGNSLINSQTSPERIVGSEVEEKSEIMFPEGQLQLTNNRVPSQEEISFIQKLISDDMREIEDLNSWIEKRQDNINLSQKAVKDLESTIEGLKAIQSFRNAKLQMYTDTRQKLVSAVELPITSPDHPHLRLDVPNLQEIKSSYQVELDQCQDMVQETKKRLEQGKVWSTTLCQRLIEKRSILEEEIHSMEVLKKSVANLQGVIHRRHQLISVRRRLPDDTLLVIFQMYIWGEMEEIKAHNSEPQSHAVLLLSSICSRWRALISATSSLWAYIPLPRPTQKHVYAINSRYLERYIKSAHAGSNIILDCPRGGPWTWQVKAKEANSSSSTQEQLQPRKIKSLDPILYFMATYLSREKIQFNPVASIGIWAKYKSGSLKTVACHWPVKTYSLRWHLPEFNETSAPIVEHLSLFLPPGNASDLMNALRPLSNLKYLTIDIREDKIQRWDDWNDEEIKLSLPELTHVSCSPALLPILLQTYVTAPNLQRITVFGVPEGEDTVSEAWKPMLNNLMLRDKILWVKFSESQAQQYTENLLIPILCELTYVETLELEGKFMLPFITHLKRNRKTGPKIQSLILRRVDIDEATLQSLLESRSRPIEDDDDQDLPPPLSIRSITFDHCTGITRRFCEELQESIDHVSVYC